MKVAWRTTWGGITSVVAAESRSQAKAITVRSAREVYPKQDVRFVDVKAIRAKEHDVWAELDSTGHCWDEKLLPKIQATMLARPEVERMSDPAVALAGLVRVSHSAPSASAVHTSAKKPRGFSM